MQPSVRSDGSDGNGAAARVRRELDAHRRSIGESDLRRMFAEDPDRTRWATVEAAGLLVDFSKHLVVPETLEFLTNLADAVGLPTARDALLTGAVVNRTEGRPALHTALRLPAGSRLDVAGEDVAADVHATLSRMGEFTDAVRSGSWRGADGRRVRTVVNIGIGGSDLGPRMAVRALRRRAVGGPEVRFIANVDGADSERALAGLDPGETLFVVCSKTFRTSETLLNARSARAWVIDALGPGAVGRHFAAASADVGAAVEFGIDPECVFGFREWVGGRYSLPSAVGLALMLAIGREAFGEMLAGFHAMDRHFAEAPLAANAPVIHGLLTVWYSGWFGAASTAVVPYAADLDRFPAYLQQLVMESNGKRVTERGDPVADPTAPVTWGEPGTDAQHSFFQLLHQGTRFVPVDLIGVARPAHDLADHHSALLANLLAQSHALAFGRTAAELADDGFGPEAAIHREVPGNRPHTVILGRELSPGFLGALVAFYEHSVFTQAVVWGIDPFDQFGVELGKGIADVVRARLDGAESDGVDAANERLIAFVRAEGFSAGS